MLKLPKIPKKWKEDIKLLPKVEVFWNDACTVMGWKVWDQCEGYNLTEIHTIGWMLPSASKFIRIAPSIGSNGDFSDVWLIPKSQVRSVRRLK